jgi:hypothetical protein
LKSPSFTVNFTILPTPSHFHLLSPLSLPPPYPLSPSFFLPPSLLPSSISPISFLLPSSLPLPSLLSLISLSPFHHLSLLVGGSSSNLSASVSSTSLSSKALPEASPRTQSGTHHTPRTNTHNMCFMYYTTRTHTHNTHSTQTTHTQTAHVFHVLFHFFSSLSFSTLPLSFPSSHPPSLFLFLPIRCSSWRWILSFGYKR